MRVQAKRIDLPQEIFRRLQRYKPRKAAFSQIDNLIAAARADRLNPAYCLYVFSRRWPRIGLWPPNPNLGYGPLSPSGCLIGHAQAIRAVGSDALSRLAFILLPWHLLVCSCSSGGFASQFAQQAYDVLSVSARIGAESKLGRLDPSGETLLFPPRESLPEHARSLFEMTDAAASSVENLVGSSRARERKIAGVMIVSSEPIAG
jgi:hypothetical protein